MTFAPVRTAMLADIPAMHRIRLLVRENRLADAWRVTEADYVSYIAASGAWVSEVDGSIVGFAIVDAPRRSIWALFVDPVAEGKGIARALHDRMIAWARDQQLPDLTLTTAPDTRAANFYRSAGWSESGSTADGELRFERDL